MKTAVRTALAMGLAGAAFGTPIGTGLAAFAQKMPAPGHVAFVLYEFDVKDPEAFKSYAPKVRASLKDYKGEFVMREKVASLFGGTPSNLSVISFPSVDDARKWLGSPELAKLNEARGKIADVRTYLVEKMD